MKQATDAARSQSHTVHLTKRIAVLRQKVFDAWIKPELRRQWWHASPDDDLHLL